MRIARIRSLEFESKALADEYEIDVKGNGQDWVPEAEQIMVVRTTTTSIILLLTFESQKVADEVTKRLGLWADENGSNSWSNRYTDNFALEGLITAHHSQNKTDAKYTFFSGRCLCGNVTYQCTAKPNLILNCHCEDCRRATGSVYGTNVFVDEQALVISGELSSYSHTADSGNTMTKRFCKNCGTLLFGKSSGRKTVSIRAGTIDQTEIIQPLMNVFNEKRISSTPLDKSLPSYPAMPSAEAFEKAK